jgi:phosphoketolase
MSRRPLSPLLERRSHQWPVATHVVYHGREVHEYHRGRQAPQMATRAPAILRHLSPTRIPMLVAFRPGSGSHCTPETPGSIHEGEEPGYVLSHACGAAFDNRDLIDKPVIFDFHGYSWLIHRLVYRRTNHNNMHVRGKGQGNINTPLELALENEIDRFSLAMGLIKRVPRLQKIWSARSGEISKRTVCMRNYAFKPGANQPDVAALRRPFKR